MRYKVLHCAGYEQAVLGMMLSYGKTSFSEFYADYVDIDRVVCKAHEKRMRAIAERLKEEK